MEEIKFRNISKIALLVLFIITAISGFLASRLGFDYDFENFFPQNDPETEFFRSFRYHFESDNDYIIVAIDNEAGAFNSAFLTKVDSMSRVFDALENVDTVVSPTRMTQPLRDPFAGNLFQKPLLRIDNTSDLKSDSAMIWEEGRLIGIFFSEDGKSVGLQINHQQYLSKENCDKLASDVMNSLSAADFDGSHAIGRSIGQEYYVSLMQRELILFMSISIVLIIIFLFIAFRSAWGIWVPISVVLLSAIWILGFMKLTGKEIDLMLIILPTIIFVVGMSDVVHLLTKYFDELRQGKSKIEAIKTSFKEIGLATFLTSLTTAVGFLTLLTSSIQPIVDFGLYTAVGVFIAFALAFTLLPSVLVLSKAPNIRERATFWQRILRKTFSYVLKKRVPIVVISVLTTALSIAGLMQLEVNNYLLEDLREGDFLKKEFRYFENKFSGGRPFEMAVLLKENESIWDIDVLRQLDT
ncbi:MAG: MMPL family transporter, partial [Flavobacteriales bacterium]|nr:MMPL family transporter [Flavobacteriales bacterium]